MKNIWRQYGRILAGAGLVIVINSIFYGYSLLPVLEKKDIFLAITATSAAELILFYPRRGSKKWLRRLQAAAYLTAAFFKLAEMIFFKQYGSYDLFSRVRQAKYLSDVVGYILGQVTAPMICFLVLSLFFPVILLWPEKSQAGSKSGSHPAVSEQKQETENGESKRLISTGSRKVRIAAALILLAAWALFCRQTEILRSIEVSHALGGSAYRAAVGKSGAAGSMTENEIQQLLFRNYRHQNEYTGIGAGKNLLIIQVESLQDSFIGQSYGGKEITPYLNGLIKKSFYFQDYFELLGFGNSSDAEYVSLQSTFSDTELGAYEDYAGTETMGLPKLARSQGYHTFSMHGNTGTFYNRQEAHARTGFEQVYMGESYEQDEIIGMGLSDESFFRQSLPRIEAAGRAGKFMGFMITLTCHGPFDMPEKDQVFAVEPELQNTTFARYLNAVFYTDRVLAELMAALEEKGILQNTVVAIYGDHHAFANVDPESSKYLAKFLGKPFDFDEMMRIPLIVYVPGYEKQVTRENIGSQIDFMPTIANIMGWNDIAAPMFGVDLLDPELSRDNIVFPQTYMLRGSYITDEELFERSRLKGGAAGRLIDRRSRAQLPEENARPNYEEANRRIETAQQMYLHNQVMDSIREFHFLLDKKGEKHYNQKN